MTSQTSSGRFVAWCGSCIVTMVVFRALAERQPTSTMWIGLCLVVAAVIGAAVHPAVERIVDSSKTALARLVHRCNRAEAEH